MTYKNVQNVVTALSSVAVAGDTPAQIKGWVNGLISELTGVMQPLDRFTKGEPMPTSLGPLADEYALVRERRLALDKEAGAVKSRETELYNCILSSLVETTTGDTGAAGKTHRVQLVTKTRYQTTDWAKVHEFIKKYGMFELLQKRLADTAVKEYIEVNDGALPDGVEAADLPALSFTKV